MTLHEHQTATESSMKTFRSPYPGLRPFQEEDLDYFFGRTTQIKEIVERLEKNRFVTVIGGSGSGKSSLVLAGAIPLLRTSSLRPDFAFEEDGNFWVSVVFTPGTNHPEGDSPIRRLAAKFCSLLKPDPKSDEDRINCCVELLRQPDGLGKIVVAYGRTLKDDGGVNLSRKKPSEDSGEEPFEVNINFLFLIDQFEELFHPSNDRVTKDCEHLVQRIVDQFKNKQKQVCIALTMRSEHLNDCPRYLDLPDVINATVYLVKRLTDEEIKEVIRKPAQRFLRWQLMQARRSAKGKDLLDEWPAKMHFEDSVVERLLEDAEEVIAKAEHADHLPLLQHLLYWTWRCAVLRNEGKPVPDAVTGVDLREAVYPDSKGADFIDPKINTLIDCLENRCENIFQSDKKRNNDWEKVFKNLAFKEPNTGTYTQKRASMEAIRKCLSEVLPDNQALKDYLSPWLKPHTYLFWDEESATVKVTHESLIRRWSRFRIWVDNDDWQFQVYMKLLEDCVQWKEKGQTDNNLITGPALQRFEEHKLSEALKNKQLCKRFAELLHLDRNQDRLQDAVADAPYFLQKSFEYRKRLEDEKKSREEAEHQNQLEMEKQALVLANTKAQNDLRRKTQYIYAGFTVLAIIACTYFYLYWQIEQKNRRLLTVYLIAAETQNALTFKDWFHTWDGPQLPLSKLNTSISKATKYNQEDKFSKNSRKISTYLFPAKLKMADEIKLQTESSTIGDLRDVMLKYAWIDRKPDKKTLSTVVDNEFIKCNEPIQLDGIDKNRTKNWEARFYPRKEKDFERYGLVVVKPDNRDSDINREPDINRGSVIKTNPDMLIFWGQIDGNNCKTHKKQKIFQTSRNAIVGFDSDLNEIISTEKDNDTQKIATMFYRISWPLKNPLKNKMPIPYTERPAIIEPITPIAHITPIAKEDDWPTFLETTKPQDFAHEVKFGGQWFRFFEEYPITNVNFKGVGTDVNNKNIGDCNGLERNLTPKATKQTGIPPDIFVQLKLDKMDNMDPQTFCLRIQNPPDRYLGSLYRINEQDDTNTIPLITDLYFGENPPEKVDIDKNNIRFKSGGTWFEQPWSSIAWQNLASKVLKPEHEIHPIDTDNEQFKTVVIWIEELNRLDDLDNREKITDTNAPKSTFNPQQ